MTQVIDCPCGKTMRAESDDDLVAQVKEHVQEDHPDMAGSMTRDKILEMAHTE